MFNRFKILIDAVGSGHEAHNTPPKSFTIWGSGNKNLPPKFPYSRPHFLNISGTDEVKLTADHKVRPIIVPRESLLWNIGYAECINSGKSTWNEDQAAIHEGVLNVATGMENKSKVEIPYTYVGLFDGHAGVGAALSAAHQLHHILNERLVDAADDIYKYVSPKSLPRHSNFEITMEELIIGALESAFLEIDAMMGEDAVKYYPAGGCTALVVLIMLGKVYIANAGDSRAVYCSDSNGFPLSMDFTPETERVRIRNLAEQKPELLQDQYTHRDYDIKPTMANLGRRVRYRNGSMKGWAYKTIETSDIKIPITAGEGKRSRIMGTISVTRGFGDHDLRSIHNQIPIKPFLSAHPQVQVINLLDLKLEDDCVVLGTDGLWDVTSNDESASIVRNSASHLSGDKRFIGAAQALVANARGKLKGETAVSWTLSNGKSASFDDISVFVIPLNPQRIRYTDWCEKYAEANGCLEDGELFSEEGEDINMDVCDNSFDSLTLNMDSKDCN